MIILLSPAKKLDFENAAPVDTFTVPQFTNAAAKLIKVLKACSPGEVKKLMNLSDKLTELNVERYKQWKQVKQPSGFSKQALFAFQGDVYVGLNPGSLDKKSLKCAQEQIRILSGLYGVLHPLDLIMPYRLEMGAKLNVGKGLPDLYTFWRESVTDALNEQLAKEKKSNAYLINLASQEYFKAVDTTVLKAPLITCHFKEKRGDTARVIGLFAKRARGMMANYVAREQLTTPEPLKDFTDGGYAFSKKSSDNQNWVFIRKSQA
jgi:cytoplasmic iron level regulating protein YaaA (DUF328/UPF0246 family)